MVTSRAHADSVHPAFHQGNSQPTIKIDGGQGSSFLEKCLIMPEIIFPSLSVCSCWWFLFIFASQLSGEIVARDDAEEDVQIKDKNVTGHNYV